MNIKNEKTLINIGIFGAIIYGLIFPTSSNMKILIPYLLASILFFNFLKLDYKLHKFLRKELLLYPLITFIILPIIIYFITINIHYDLRIGFFLITIAPTAVSSPIVTNLINGNKELNFAFVVFSNILAPLTYATMIYLFFNKNNLEISILNIFLKISAIIVIPVLLTLLVKKKNYLFKKCNKLGSFYTPIAFILIIAIAFSSASARLRTIDFFTLSKIFVITGFTACTFYFIGFLIAKDITTKKTLAISLGQKNTAFSVWIALANFNTLSVLPIIAYIFFHHTINALLIYKYHK